MADAVTAEFTGMAALLEELRQLPAAMRQRLLLGTVATGASVIRQEAKRLAPVWTGDVSKGHPPPGTLQRAIYQARLVADCTPTTEVWIVSVRAGKKFQAVKRGKGEVNLDAYYARWVEYGHYSPTPRSLPGTRAMRRTAARASGQAVWVPAKPFMRPAFDNKKEAAGQAMQKYLTENLPAAVVGFRMLRAIA